MFNRFNDSRVQWVKFVQGFNLFKLLNEYRVQLDNARVMVYIDSRVKFVERLHWFKGTIDSIGLMVQLVNWLQ